MALQDGLCGERIQVPDSRSLIGAGGSESFSVGRELQPADPAAVTGERCDGLTGMRIPKFDVPGRIGRPGSESLSVWRDRQR